MKATWGFDIAAVIQYIDEFHTQTNSYPTFKAIAKKLGTPKFSRTTTCGECVKQYMIVEGMKFTPRGKNVFLCIQKCCYFVVSGRLCFEKRGEMGQGNLLVVKDMRDMPI